jgi:hypothetical protein
LTEGVALCAARRFCYALFQPLVIPTVAYRHTLTDRFFMPSLKLTFPHQLGQPEAVARLKNLLTRVKEKYQEQVSDLQEAWNGNMLNFSFSTYGFKVSGDVIVQPTEVQLDGQIPVAAMMFKGKIENAIRDQLAKELA